MIIRVLLCIPQVKNETLLLKIIQSFINLEREICTIICRTHLYSVLHSVLCVALCTYGIF